MGWSYGVLFNNAEEFIQWLQGKQNCKITEVHVHHTYSPSHKDFTGKNHRTLQDGMRKYHLSKGWVDIAQHITIFPDGKIMTGRNINVPPASATGYNDSNADGKHPFMFEMVGNFDKGHDKLQGKQLESAVKVTRYFHQKGAGIRFHRQCLINGKSPKTCPGTGVDYNWFVSLVKNAGNVSAQPQQLTLQDMYDLSYLSDYKLKGVISSKHPEEIVAKVKWAMDARANCVLLLKRGFDLRILQKALNEMYPDSKQ